MTIVLPKFEEAPTRSRGRNVRAGYQRGWGLQFGDLTGQLHQDKLYNRAMKLARKRTVVSEHNRMNLYLILRFGFEGLAPGHIVEFGAYRGGNALFMAAVCRELHPGMKVYAFDTYEGMPATDPERDAHRAGDFKDAGYNELVEIIESEKSTTFTWCGGSSRTPRRTAEEHRFGPPEPYRLRHLQRREVQLRGI